MKTGATRRNRAGSRSTLVLMSVLLRTVRIDAPMEPDADLDVRRQLGRYHAFDEIPEKAADEVVRVTAAQGAVGEKIHMSPIDGGTR